MTATNIWIRLIALAWLAGLVPLSAQEAPKSAPTASATTTRSFESPGSIQQRVIQFLKNHPSIAPESQLEVSTADTPLNLPACREISTYLPGNPLKVSGTTKVAVRCHAPSTWLVFVTAKVLTLQRYWVWTDDLPSGSVLTGQELSQRTAWMEQTPIGAESDLNFFIGKTTKQNVVKGAIATSSMIKIVPVITAGQVVKITVNGNGFKISTDGKALSSALSGQSIQVRMSNGQLVSGVASPDGTVEVWRP